MDRDAAIAFAVDKIAYKARLDKAYLKEAYDAIRLATGIARFSPMLVCGGERLDSGRSVELQHLALALAKSGCSTVYVSGVADELKLKGAQHHSIKYIACDDDDALALHMIFCPGSLASIADSMVNTCTITVVAGKSEFDKLGIKPKWASGRFGTTDLRGCKELPKEKHPPAPPVMDFVQDAVFLHSSGIVMRMTSRYGERKSRDILAVPLHIDADEDDPAQDVFRPGQPTVMNLRRESRAGGCLLYLAETRSCKMSKRMQAKLDDPEYAEYFKAAKLQKTWEA